MALNGRGNKADIDWNKVDQLLEAGCLSSEIAAYFGIHRHTLYNRCQQDKNVEFSTYRQEKKAKGESLLRAKQFQTAMAGNVPMQIWIGKQRLDQRDKPEEKKTIPPNEEILKTQSENIILKAQLIESQKQLDEVKRKTDS